MGCSLILLEDIFSKKPTTLVGLNAFPSFPFPISFSTNWSEGSPSTSLARCCKTTPCKSVGRERVCLWFNCSCNAWCKFPAAVGGTAQLMYGCKRSWSQCEMGARAQYILLSLLVSLPSRFYKGGAVCVHRYPRKGTYVSIIGHSLKQHITLHVKSTRWRHTQVIIVSCNIRQMVSTQTPRGSRLAFILVYVSVASPPEDGLSL